MNDTLCKVIPFEAAHLNLMDIRGPEAELVKQNPEKYEALASLGIGGTMLYDGRILGALGLFENWPGNYEVWVIPTIHITKHPRPFLRTIRNYIKTVFETHPVHRMQSPALADTMHDKWMRHFGFVNETPNGMQGYGANKKTFNLWSITKL